MKKAELLTAAGSLQEIIRYAEAGADAVQIGEQQFAMRLPGEICGPALKEAVDTAHRVGLKVYVVANRIMDNQAVPLLPAYLAAVQEAGADAVVFGDPAVLAAAKEAGLTGLRCHWNPEMTATNYATANYWASKGSVRAILARELNLEQVLEFKRNCISEIQVQVHGITNMFHSKRRMVTSYMEHRGDTAGSSAGYSSERGMYLVEEERQDERYPIYEDETGTHIMSGDDVCMLDALQELLEAGIDSLKVESLMKPVEYNEVVLKAYRAVMDTYYADPAAYVFRQEWLDAVEAIQPADRPLSYGFYYKEQVY